MVGQIENVAQNSQQILVQQAPGGPPSTSLQDMLQLPAYPTDEGVALGQSHSFHAMNDADQGILPMAAVACYKFPQLITQ